MHVWPQLTNLPHVMRLYWTKKSKGKASNLEDTPSCCISTVKAAFCCLLFITLLMFQNSTRNCAGFDHCCMFGSYLKLLWNSDWPTCYSNVTVLVDVAGALPSQLQGHWGEMASCCLHHQFTHCAVSCVENVVKSLPQQLLGLWHSTCHHWIQILQRE